MNSFPITDIADEVATRVGLEVSSRRLRGAMRTDVVVTPEISQAAGKDAGRYITVDCSEGYDEKNVAHALASAITDLQPRYKTALVIGLGNAAMIADALGPKAVERIVVTRHMRDEMSLLGAGDAAAFCPNVMGVTGIESADIIAGVAHQIKPDLIICIDSLACSRTDRLAMSYQITDTGITPGGGIGNRRIKLNRASLGVPVIAVGVPMVVYARTIAAEVLAEAGVNSGAAISQRVLGNLVVTPKEIDILVNRCASTVAAGINKYLHPKVDNIQALAEY